MRTPAQRGVTIIELLIGIVVLGMLIGVGVPAFRTWMQNSQIRTAADGVLNGLQLARTEAVRRNKPVEFRLDGGTNWTVSQVSPRTELQKREGDEGSSRALLAVLPGGSLVTFSPIGVPLQTNPADGSAPFTQIDVNTSVPDVSGVRTLRIVISTSGSVRMCDPPTNDPPLAADDPRRC
jgi:type IV fimbrial biogenesis protein FimT